MDEEYAADIERFDRMMDELAKKPEGEKSIPICPNCRTVPSRRIGYRFTNVSYRCNCGYPGPPAMIMEHELKDARALIEKLDAIKAEYIKQNPGQF